VAAASGTGDITTTVTLLPAGTVTFTGVAQISPSATGTLSNTATVAVPPGDNTPNDNTATDTTTLTPEADLALIKTVGPGPFTVGQEATFTLTVTNHGPSTEPEASLVDMLPAGVTFVSASVPPVSQSGGTLTFHLGSLGAGDSAVVMVVVRTDQVGTAVNQAEVSGTVTDLVSSNNSAGATITVTAAEKPPTVVSLQRFGYHAQSTILVLTFSEPLDAARAQDLANYHLTLIAHGGHLRLPLRLTSAVYNATADTVTLHPAKLLPLRFKYELVVNGSTPTGVSSSSGVLLDGVGNGVPGSDFVRVFGSGFLAGPNRALRTGPIRAAGHRLANPTHSTTSVPRPVPHTLPSTGRGKPIHTTAAGNTPVRLDATAVDRVLAKWSTARR
jgi:uncharacterized repeat protein (TIGR01451 family)